MYDYPAKRSDKFRDTGDDGDTLLFWLSEGLNDAAEEPIRLAGVRAPESHQAGGRESAAELNLICEGIEERAHAHRKRWPFMVFTEPNTAPDHDERRSFVRWVGTVYAFDADLTREPSVNDQMIQFLAAHPEWGGGIGLPRDDMNG
jgi:hypothetical protein